MDAAHFDQLARTLACGASRRGLLKGLAAGLLSGVVRARATDAAAQRVRGRPNGEPCTRATECAGFHCVDGVCCDTACTGQCESCAGGVCAPVTGAPIGDRPACPGADVCQASCDGVAGAHCTGYSGLDVACADPVCEGVWLTTYGCDGNGNCHPTTTNCSPYRCAIDGLACGETCAGDDECGDGAACVNGQCLSELPSGEPCTTDSACASGFCVDEVCCVERCGTCEVCNAPGNAGFCGPGHEGEICLDDDLCCEGDCIDVQIDVEHCGECNRSCLGIANGRAVCIGGNCDIECLPGFLRCDVPETVCVLDTDTSCCTDLDCDAAAWCDIPAHVCVADRPDGGDCVRSCPPELTRAECASDNMCLFARCPEDVGVCGCSADKPCPDGQICIGTLRQCVDLQPAFGPCSNDGQCRSGVCNEVDTSCGCATSLDCPPEAPTCNTDPDRHFCFPDAVVCDDDGVCASGEWCGANICHPDRSYGEACSRGGQCLSGSCIANTCA